MFLAIRSLYVCTVKLQRWIVFFIAFIGEANFSSLLLLIRVERHFPLESRLTYFREVRVELRVWIIFINHFWKQNCVICKNLTHWGYSAWYITGLKIEVVLKQNVVEHLHKYFAMKTFDHLEQPCTDDQSDNFLVTLEDYRQYHKFLI